MSVEMSADDFLQEQRFYFDACYLPGAAAAFEIPLILVHGDRTRIIFSAQELINLLDSLRRRIRLKGELGGVRKTLFMEEKMTSLSMVTFEDEFINDLGVLTQKFRLTYVFRKPLEKGAVMIVIIDQASCDCDMIFGESAGRAEELPVEAQRSRA